MRDNYQRLAACRGRYFSLQNAGLHRGGVKPAVMSYIWRTAVQPALTYAGECLPLRKTHLLEMDMLQSKLVKNSLGFSKYLKSSALLNALNVNTITKLVHVNSMNLLCKMLNNSSRSQLFYVHACQVNHNNDKIRENNLYSRCELFCRSQCFSLTRCIVSRHYMSQVKKSVLRKPVNDGVMDSVSSLLKHFTNEDQNMIKLLLSPF